MDVSNMAEKSATRPVGCDLAAVFKSTRRPFYGQVPRTLVDLSSMSASP